jgi:hypothetical protein
MGKIKLNPDPTFSAPVTLPVPGKPSVEVEFTFKHRTRSELKAFIDVSGERQDADTIMAMCTGWELEEVFNKDNVDLLVENLCLSAPSRVFNVYLDQLIKGREKN